MIIQCKSCSTKFIARDIDIPAHGRLVQCGYCSVTWHQMPNKNPTKKTKKLDKTPIDKIQDNDFENDNSKNEMVASDGKKYKHLGNQWAQLLPSGKTGIFAKKAISIELDKQAGIKRKKTIIKNYQETKIFDPSDGTVNPANNLPDLYKDKKDRKSIGFFGYIFVIIIIITSSVGAMKVFEDYILNYLPNSYFVFEIIDKQLEFFSETFKNMITILNDLLDDY